MLRISHEKAVWAEAPGAYCRKFLELNTKRGRLLGWIWTCLAAVIPALLQASPRRGKGHCLPYTGYNWSVWHGNHACAAPWRSWGYSAESCYLVHRYLGTGSGPLCHKGKPIQLSVWLNSFKTALFLKRKQNHPKATDFEFVVFVLWVSGISQATDTCIYMSSVVGPQISRKRENQYTSLLDRLDKTSRMNSIFNSFSKANIYLANMYWIC